MTPLLEIRDLHVRFDTPDGEVRAVRGVDLAVAPGETLAIVGESGSGKSQIMMAAMGLLARNGRAEGAVRFRGADILGLPSKALNRFRGPKMAMIFQEPMTSLDPLRRIGRQIAEPMIRHRGLTRAAARARTLELLRLVRLPEPERRLDAYPHELSGGQRQRVMIAMALGSEPELLIADEPTTALDVTVQAQILDLLADLQQRLGMAMIVISHDLRVVRRVAARVCVMENGRIVETGAVGALFARPQEAYTRMLLAAEPEGRKAPVAANAPPLLDARGVTVRFALRGGGFFARPLSFTAVADVSLSLKAGQTVGIVGESGSGKSTLGRALLRLLPSEGQVVFDGAMLGDERATRPLRRAMQVVFQDPYGSLSPRMTVGDIVGEGLLVHEPALDRAAREARVAEALGEVGLDPGLRNRYPHEFSGGQRQRVAIARALVLRPKFLLLDEPTSALDRSVQKQVVELLRRLQRELGLTYLFISHDLAVVRALADAIVVMKDGRIVEQGPTEAILTAPRTDYARALMAAAFEGGASISPQGGLGKGGAER